MLMRFVSSFKTPSSSHELYQDCYIMRLFTFGTLATTSTWSLLHSSIPSAYSNSDLVDIESPLSDEELYVLSQQYNNEGDFVSVQTRFNYAWGLIKSRKVEDQQLGVQILAQVYKDTPSRRRECLYYLAIGSYKLGEYTDARKYCDLLLQIEPDDPQSAKLRQIIEDKLAKEGMIGIAIVGGVIAVGAAVLGAVLSQKKR